MMTAHLGSVTTAPHQFLGADGLLGHGFIAEIHVYANMYPEAHALAQGYLDGLRDDDEIDGNFSCKLVDTDYGTPDGNHYIFEAQCLLPA